MRNKILPFWFKKLSWEKVPSSFAQMILLTRQFCVDEQNFFLSSFFSMFFFRGSFLESPGNLPGPISVFQVINVFLTQVNFC